MILCMQMAPKTEPLSPLQRDKEALMSAVDEAWQQYLWAAEPGAKAAARRTYLQALSRFSDYASYGVLPSEAPIAHG